MVSARWTLAQRSPFATAFGLPQCCQNEGPPLCDGWSNTTGDIHMSTIVALILNSRKSVLCMLILFCLSYFIQFYSIDDEPDRLSNRLLEYNPIENKWTELCPMMYSKYRCSAVVLNNEIYVMGKKNEFGFSTGNAQKCQS